MLMTLLAIGVAVKFFEIYGALVAGLLIGSVAEFKFGLRYTKIKPVLVLLLVFASGIIAELTVDHNFGFGIFAITCAVVVILAIAIGIIVTKGFLFVRDL
ncbi:hypothetical protein KKA09_02000 [Patescibacteria group bacterium]|nr:hypothetical protein [Patescibacteria group bacterium]